MKKRVAAIGTFDGVHRGHRSVLKVLTEYAIEKDMEPIAITFDRHPLALIDPNRLPPTLTPLKTKEQLLRESGAIPMVINFDEPLRSTTSRQLMKLLHDEYDVRALVVGYDNTFGSDGIFLSIDDYKKLGKNEGIEVLSADEVSGVSSSAIRKAVVAGDMEKSSELLGRPYSITSKVISGNHVGNTLGFPTANIEAPQDVAMPRQGVYAAIVKTLEDNKEYPAMVNVGIHPTVMCGEKQVIEAHILDWEGDLYDKEITVKFLKRIRDEKKFDSIDELKEQLKKDKEFVEKLNF